MGDIVIQLLFFIGQALAPIALDKPEINGAKQSDIDTCLLDKGIKPADSPHEKGFADPVQGI
jgi:hypothetical protein